MLQHATFMSIIITTSISTLKKSHHKNIKNDLMKSKSNYNFGKYRTLQIHGFPID